MSRKLDDLSNAHGFRQKVFEFLARLTEAGIQVLVVDTLRTEEEQKQNILNGVSWTLNSKHLPHEPDGKSLAIDVAPYETYNLVGKDKLMWQSNDPVWQKMGEIGEGLGLRWGGRFKQRDMGHFEYTYVPPIVRSHMV